MFDFTNARRTAASIVGAAILSSACVLTAIAPARAADTASAASHRPIVAELAVASLARN